MVGGLGEKPKKECAPLWCRKIAKKLVAGPEIADPEPFIDIKRMPRWAKRASAELLLQGHPGIRFEHFQDPSPKTIGYILGQKWANYRSGADWNDMQNRRAADLKIDPKSSEWLALIEAWMASAPDHPVVRTLTATDRLLEQGLEQMPSDYHSFIEIMHEAFRTALEQPRYEDTVDFFRGFAGGIGNPGARNGKSTANTSATPIYAVVGVCWPDIRKLRSLIELRTFLVAAGISEPLLGSQKRLEKLCQRIGLRLARRGRPKRRK